MLDKVLFSEMFLPWSHCLVLQKAIDPISKDGRAKVSLRRLIECYLTQICACIGVGSYQYVGIRIEENTERQKPLVQQYLGRGLVLSVEKPDLSASLFGRVEPGEWNEATRRSALALRLLTYVPTGAIVAAPTTSLPERIGGDRNYDYRYAWVRDTAFTLDALINLDLLVQVHASFAWLLRAVENTEPDLHVFYDLDGETVSGQEELELDGYRGARPVRRGNGAAGQLQLGCYGDLLETVELYVRDGNALDDVTAGRLAEILDHLTTIWTKQDSGIWELPDKEHYTISKLGVWTAFDRALRLVERGQLPRDRAARWRECAKDVREFIEGECWSDTRGCYVMFPDSDKLDASVLRSSRMGFLDVQGEEFSSLLDAVRDELDAGEGLLYRYSGQQQVEGAFVACSFWLVEALARAGRVDEARETMRQVLARRNDVGLFSEEIDPGTGAFLGNFPQGLSHLALINAAGAIRAAEAPQ